MSNQIGSTLKLQIFGESHGPYIGGILDGLAPGFTVDEMFITQQLKTRQPQFTFNTTRIEDDKWQFVSGVHQGRTTGAPLAVLIENSAFDSSEYNQNDLPRPSHADYAAKIKYQGFNDQRGGGVFSGRTTVALVALGALCRKILAKKGVLIGSHIFQVDKLYDKYDERNLSELITTNLTEPLVVYDPEIKTQIIEFLNETKAAEDSCAAIVESHVLNLPIGIGEPYFAGLESSLATALFSIPSIKGLEFGSGFSLVDLPGSLANDEFYLDGEQIKTTTNHSGGVNGGLSNGMPLSFKTIIKAPSSIGKTQKTVNLKTDKEENITIVGRHDSFIANRVMVVLDNMIAYVILDLCLSQFGKEWML